ncbi:MAG: 2-dehydropantoate 2-reductase [Gammaproteobacteria bacterium]|nr:2-dehydropantoate 2-reductase [Gammaproteobacteria bacterium]
MNEPWHILGAGALGGLWAGLLALAGQEVVLLTRTSPADGRRRLVLDLGDQDQELLLPAEAAGPDGPPIRRLLVCTKAYDVAPALAGLAPRLGPDTAVVLLPNGLGYREEAAASLAGCRVFPATTTQGAWRKADGGIVRAGSGELWLGAERPEDEVRGRELVDALSLSGIACHYAPDIEARLWQKLAVNGAINAATALLQCRNGELLHEPHGPALLAQLCAETEYLYRALRLPGEAGELLVRARFVAAQTAQNYSSMCQDLRAGRRTELVYINGYLLLRGEALGLDLPAHRLLTHLLGLRQDLH